MFLSFKNASQISSVLAYCLSSILMTLTNKYVLTEFHFKNNFLLLAIQSTCCFAFLKIFKVLGLIELSNFDHKIIQRWMPVSFSLVFMIYTGSKALQNLSIPEFTVFKNITIILIAYGEVYLLKAKPVTKSMLLSFLLIAGSSLLALFSEETFYQITTVQSSSDSEYSQSLSANGEILLSKTKYNLLQSHYHQFVSASLACYFNLIGYFWMITNCICSATYVLLMRTKISKLNMKDFDTVYYNNLLSIPILFLLSIVHEFRLSSFTLLLLSESPGIDNTAQQPNSSHSISTLTFVIIFSGVCTIAISYCTSWCIRVTSSTTYSMVGALNKLPIAISGIIFFKTTVNAGKILSIFIALVAGLVYAHAKKKQRIQHPALSYEELKNVMVDNGKQH